MRVAVMPDGGGDNLFSDVWDDADKEVAVKTKKRATARCGDHYSYFATIPCERMGSAAENQRRLRWLWRRCRRARVGCTPVHGDNRRSASPSGHSRRTSSASASGLSRRTSSPERDCPSSVSNKSSSRAGTPGLSMSSSRKGKTPIPGNQPNTAEVPVKPTGTALVDMKEQRRVRDVCEALRFLAFGNDYVGAAGKRNIPFHEQCRGTREEVSKLQALWEQIDEDGSGEVSVSEFINFFNLQKQDRLLGMRIANHLLYQSDDKHGSSAKVSCTVEDMMQMIWLKATPPDIGQMLHWFFQAEFEKDHVPTPPPLSQRKRREILHNFPGADWSRRSSISFVELTDGSAIDFRTVEDFWRRSGKSTNDEITEAELLEMLCPLGYRAHEDSTTAVDRKGRQIMYVSNQFMTGWCLSSDRVMRKREFKRRSAF